MCKCSWWRRSLVETITLHQKHVKIILDEWILQITRPGKLEFFLATFYFLWEYIYPFIYLIYVAPFHRFASYQKHFTSILWCPVTSGVTVIEECKWWWTRWFSRRQIHTVNHYIGTVDLLNLCGLLPPHILYNLWNLLLQRREEEIGSKIDIWISLHFGL